MMLQERIYIKPLLVACLVWAAGTAYAEDPIGDNLNYAMDGTTLVLTSPDPTIPATVYASAFLNRTDITAVIFPDNLTDISTSAFAGCTLLQEVVIPPLVTNIGAYAFYECSQLSDVLCRPQTAPDLGTDAFTDCHAGLQICVPSLGEYRYASNWISYFEALTLKECFLDEYDGQDIMESKISDFRDASVSEVNIFRTLRKAGCFNTLTLPFNVPDIASSPLGGNNVEVYTFSSATVEYGTLLLDVEKVTTNSLTAGTPYLIQWTNTGEVLNRMRFEGITWDDNETADDAGTDQVIYHGFYGITHIDDAISGDRHLNLFLLGNNQLYWPEEDDTSSMLGFRAWFQISMSGALPAPVHRGMPAALRIKSTPTDIEAVKADSSLQEGERGRLVLSDGRLIIIRNGESYSITGQKL